MTGPFYDKCSKWKITLNELENDRQHLFQFVNGGRYTVKVMENNFELLFNRVQPKS